MAAEENTVESKPTVGFIGLGIMGHPMALNLQRAGYPLVVVDFEPPLPQDLVDGGGGHAEGPRKGGEPPV